tara:strand:- start:443 stop:799 length:357 start_codon:yes stop_codon:yes gene_type:complete
MYEKKTLEEISNELIRNETNKYKIIVISKTTLLCTTHGIIYRKMKSGFWKKIENKINHNKGYNVILINNKQYSRSKIILHAFKKLSLDNKNINIHHLNNQKLDCSCNNLYIKSNSIIN